jgi:hypothetical protein
VLKDKSGAAVPPGTVNPAPNPSPVAKRASARFKLGKRLRANRRRQVRVRVNCAGDAGAACQGKVRLVRRGRTLGSRTFRIAAGETATVRVTLKRSAFKALKKAKRGKVATLRISGGDSSGAKLAAQQSVRLLRPKQR